MQSFVKREIEKQRESISQGIWYNVHVFSDAKNIKMNVHDIIYANVIFSTNSGMLAVI